MIYWIFCAPTGAEPPWTEKYFSRPPGRIPECAPVKDIPTKK